MGGSRRNYREWIASFAHVLLCLSSQFYAGASEIIFCKPMKRLRLIQSTLKASIFTGPFLQAKLMPLEHSLPTPQSDDDAKALSNAWDRLMYTLGSPPTDEEKAHTSWLTTKGVKRLVRLCTARMLVRADSSDGAHWFSRRWKNDSCVSC